MVIVIRALNEIPKGQEITVHYGDIFGREGQFKCNCSPGCKKTLSGHIHPLEMMQKLEDYKKHHDIYKQYKGLTCDDETDIEERINFLEEQANFFKSLGKEGSIPHDSLPVCRETLVRAAGESTASQTDGAHCSTDAMEVDRTVEVEMLEQK